MGFKKLFFASFFAGAFLSSVVTLVFILTASRHWDEIIFLWVAAAIYVGSLTFVLGLGRYLFLDIIRELIYRSVQWQAKKK